MIDLDLTKTSLITLENGDKDMMGREMLALALLASTINVWAEQGKAGVKSIEDKKILATKPLKGTGGVEGELWVFAGYESGVLPSIGGEAFVKVTDAKSVIDEISGEVSLACAGKPLDDKAYTFVQQLNSKRNNVYVVLGTPHLPKGKSGTVTLKIYVGGRKPDGYPINESFSLSGTASFCP